MRDFAPRDIFRRASRDGRAGIPILPEHRVLLVFVFWMLFALGAAAMLSKSNRAGMGCLLGLLLGPIGILIAWTMRDDHAKAEAKEEALAAEERIARAVAKALEEERRRAAGEHASD